MVKICKAFSCIVTRNKNYLSNEGFYLASSPKAALDLLKNEHCTKVLLVGGSNLNYNFAKLGLINEIIVNIEAVVIGEGIPLFFNNDFELNLELLNIKKISNKVLQLHYKVKN